MDFNIFSWVSRHGCLHRYIGMKRPGAPTETFARFHAGFLSPEDFHRIFRIFMDFMDCMDFYISSQIFIDFNGFRDMGAYIGTSV